MMLAIIRKTIMMMVIAVHLMHLQIGINIVKHVNAGFVERILAFARTIGPRKNVARSVMPRNVANPKRVRQTVRSLAIYAELWNLARIKKVPSIARSKRKRGNVTNQVSNKNARRLVMHAILINNFISIKSFFSKTVSFESSTYNFSDETFCTYVVQFKSYCLDTEGL